jgi:hypothetical protein
MKFIKLYCLDNDIWCQRGKRSVNKIKNSNICIEEYARTVDDLKIRAFAAMLWQQLESGAQYYLYFSTFFSQSPKPLKMYAPEQYIAPNVNGLYL